MRTLPIHLQTVNGTAVSMKYKSQRPKYWRVLILIASLGQAQAALAFEWLDLWLTPDQQGQRLMDQGNYALAATKFTHPESIGTALFMDGDFERAAAVFGRSNTAEASYNRGNALIMLGNYDEAINAYNNALTTRPDWIEAQENLTIAILRKQAMATPEDDFGGTDGMLSANEYVFDLDGSNNNSSNEEVVESVSQQVSEAEMRAMWLRKVETRPADFLAIRFNYQLATQKEPLQEANSNE